MLFNIALTVKKNEKVTESGSSKVEQSVFIDHWRKNFPGGAEVRWEAYCKGRLELSGGSYLRNKRSTESDFFY